MPLEPVYEIEYDAAGEPIRMWWRGFQPSWKDQMKTWREVSAPIIAKVIAETKPEELHLLKDRLRAAFPWGQYEKNYHPTRIWRDECQRQLGLKPPLQRGGRRPEPVPVEQGKLFV